MPNKAAMETSNPMQCIILLSVMKKESPIYVYTGPSFFIMDNKKMHLTLWHWNWTFK